jgi:molybdenum cofactor biosynthesis enzyme
MKRYSSNESILTHIDSITNEPKQVDVGCKTISPERFAIASGHIQLNRYAFDALVKNKLKKGKE